MPKIKSHRGAMKRFRKTKSGKIKRSKACRGHLKRKKTSKKKRELRKSVFLSRKDIRRLRRLMTNAA